jgi:hypothetical protein
MGSGGMMGPGMGSGGMMGPGMGSGGMMGPGTGSGGMMGPGLGSGGMMGPGDGYPSPGVATPLTPETARAAIQARADRVNANLTVAEVMVFSNHAYGIVAEKDTGIGAFEVLVDHATSAVTREPGAGMMWNLKYPVMGGGASAPTSRDMPVSEAAAIQAAQRYLDSYAPGAKAEDHANRFYGYYTLDIARNGRPAGMLSVNGFTGAVFYHHWHGVFVAEQDFGAPR